MLASPWAWRGVLDDLGAEVGRTDGAEVLLVGLAVGGVLVKHVRRARLDLALEDLEPQVLRLDGLAALAFCFVLRVERFKLRSPAVGQTWASVGAHERPIAVFFDALHEQVRRPEGVEQIAGALLLLSVVLAQVEEVENVRVPWLDVHGKRTLTLSTALVHVACRVVEDAEHGDDAVGRAIGSFDVRARSTDVVNGKASKSIFKHYMSKSNPCVLWLSNCQITNKLLQAIGDDLMWRTPHVFKDDFTR